MRSVLHSVVTIRPASVRVEDKSWGFLKGSRYLPINFAVFKMVRGSVRLPIERLVDQCKSMIAGELVRRLRA